MAAKSPRSNFVRLNLRSGDRTISRFLFNNGDDYLEFCKMLALNAEVTQADDATYTRRQQHPQGRLRREVRHH